MDSSEIVGRVRVMVAVLERWQKYDRLSLVADETGQVASVASGLPCTLTNFHSTQSDHRERVKKIFEEQWLPEITNQFHEMHDEWANPVRSRPDGTPLPGTLFQSRHADPPGFCRATPTSSTCRSYLTASRLSSPTSSGAPLFPVLLHLALCPLLPRCARRAPLHLLQRTDRVPPPLV